MREGFRKKLVVLGNTALRTPPISREARRKIGQLISRLQYGASLSMPFSRPMPSIGRRCHELRVRDGDISWRVIYRNDHDEVLVVALFEKKTQRTPRRVIARAKQLLGEYHR